MKIAQVAPLYESVPPRLYGGTLRRFAEMTHPKDSEIVRAGIGLF